MRTEEIIRNLNYTIKKHRNDIVGVGQTNITSMCKDILPKMEKLKAYEDAEEQGLLLHLPCKVGDRVWVLNKIKKEIFPTRVEHIEYIVNDNLEFPLTKIKGEGFCVFFDDFNKIVFLTKEEAEQKLAEMRKE